jgi:UDPglucose 6-dehydrogenase
VLPGTVKKFIEPIIEKRGVGDFIELVYSPSFIAMGSAIHDFKHPEFQLIGTNSGADISKLTSLYSTIHDRPQFVTTVQNAELIKVLYNTFIGMKIVFANTCMEACHKIPNTDVDQISKALSLATERVVSARYLQGGMGDGGGCHPRDNIAMSWLARELDLSYDIFSDVIRARESQTRWLVSLIKQELACSHLPVVLLGDSYKGDCSLKTGSPARLLSYYLSEQGIEHQVHDPYNEESTFQKNTAAIYFISTRHTAWVNFNFPPSSVVLDPFRYLVICTPQIVPV